MDVIQAELAHRSGLTTVLAAITIAREEGFAIESDGRLGNTIVEDEPNDARDL